MRFVPLPATYNGNNITILGLKTEENTYAFKPGIVVERGIGSRLFDVHDTVLKCKLAVVTNVQCVDLDELNHPQDVGCKYLTVTPYGREDLDEWTFGGNAYITALYVECFKEEYARWEHAQRNNGEVIHRIVGFI